MMKFRLGKSEKLKSRKQIQLLFEEGSQIKVFPLKLLYFQAEHNSTFPIQTAFSVPKKNFKKAVDRNHLKRLMREVYRKQKPNVYRELNKPHIFMFIFMGNKKVEYQTLEESMSILLSKFLKKRSDDKTNITK